LSPHRKPASTQGIVFIKGIRAAPMAASIRFFLKISLKITCLRVPHGDHRGHYRTRSPTIARHWGPCRPHEKRKDAGEDDYVQMFLRFSSFGVNHIGSWEILEQKPYRNISGMVFNQNRNRKKIQNRDPVALIFLFWRFRHDPIQLIPDYSKKTVTGYSGTATPAPSGSARRNSR